MISSHELMTIYRECSGINRTAGGDVLPIEGVGDILLRFPSNSGAFDIQLLNVAFVPQLSHNLLSLQQFTAAHHTYFGTINGVELQFKPGRTLQGRTFGRTNVLRGYRMTRNDDKAFRATIAPGVKPPNFNMNVDIDDFHCSFGYVHEGLLRETAKQANVNLTGTLRECQGCSIAKGCAKSIATTTGIRAGVGGEDKKPQSSDPRRWSLPEWSPTRVGRTKWTSSPREATPNQSTSRLATERAKMRTKNCTSSLSAPRHQPLWLLPKGGPRNCHR